MKEPGLIFSQRSNYLLTIEVLFHQGEHFL